MHDIVCSVLCSNAHQDMLVDLYNNLLRLILIAMLQLYQRKSYLDLVFLGLIMISLELDFNVGEQR